MATTQGAAVFFQRPSLEEILEAVDLAAARIVALREKAQLCAKRWNIKNGLERLADRIFELAGVN